MKNADDRQVKKAYEAPRMTVLGPVAAFTFQGSPGGTVKGGVKGDKGTHDRL